MTDESADLPDDELDLKEALGLPDRLPPIRLPAEGELADLARRDPVLARAGRLARWLGEGRPVADDELGGGDVVEAVRAVGLDVPPIVNSMRDVPEFTHLWDAAEMAGFIEVDWNRAAPAGGGREWPEWPDGDVLDAWAGAFASTLESLTVDAAYIDPDLGADLDFGGAGVTIGVMAFLGRSEGVPLSEVTTVLRELATADLAPSDARAGWDAWRAGHEDPARVLLARLSELGAVTLDGDDMMLTPLAAWAMRDQLLAEGIEVPLSPPVAEMTAADLVAAADGNTEEEAAAEAAAWLALRGPLTGVRELLDVALSGGPLERMFASSLAAEAGSVAEAVWRDLLGEPTMAAYAKLALVEISGFDVYDAPAELTLSLDDIAWMLTDVLATTADTPEEIAAQLKEAIPPGQEEELFEVMSRLPHPDAGDVLTSIGDHHPDKKIARSARVAARRADGTPR